MTSISCIIPAYNEADNIAEVLNVVKDYNNFDEVIVIDDGSSDDTSEIVKTFENEKIKLVVNEKNLGKTGTIIKGVNLAKGELIVMLDSDLINLTHDNIDRLIMPVIDEEYSLTILDRAGDRKAIWGWTTGARFFGGERALWKKDFQEISLPEGGGYLLEIFMNLHFIKKNKRIKTIYCDNLYTVHDYNKRGFWEGYKHYYNMSAKILKASGVMDFSKQFWGVEEDLLHRVFGMYDTKYLKYIVAPFIPPLSLATGMAYFISLNLRGFSILPKREQIFRLKEWGYAKISKLKKSNLMGSSLLLFRKK